MTVFKRAAVVLAGIIVAGSFTGCAFDVDDAEVVDKNIKKAADNFEVIRRVVFVNGITDKYILEVVGNCSVENKATVVRVTCKTGDDKYIRHILGRSDNLTYFVEQLEVANVSDNFYRINFKPSVLIPQIDIR